MPVIAVRCRGAVPASLERDGGGLYEPQLSVSLDCLHCPKAQLHDTAGRKAV